MSTILAEKNEFQRILERLNDNPELHPSIQKLNDWEKESIAKVQRRAATLRQQLLELTVPHGRQLAEKLEHLPTQITDNDLHHWKKTLDDLKKNYLSPSTIVIDEYMKDPLVKNIYVASLSIDELFLKVSDENVRIEENGQLAIHNTSLNTTGIRGRNVYSTGCHQIRVRIEHSNDKWTFFGVDSSLIPLRAQSHTNFSSYGWSNNQFTWSGGQVKQNLVNKPIEMRTNDVIDLLFDCDEHLIMMINERSKARYELPIQIDHCPLPWQLHIALHEPNSRLRILQQ